MPHATICAVFAGYTIKTENEEHPPLKVTEVRKQKLRQQASRLARHLPKRLYFDNGETLDVGDSVAEARAKLLAKDMKPFVTTVGNPNFVKMAATKDFNPLNA